MIDLSEVANRNVERPSQLLDNDSACRHCRQLLQSSTQINSGYCCNGCQAAALFIQTAGLSYFYCLRDATATALPFKNSEASTFGYFDDSTFFSRFTQTKQGLIHIKFHLEGLHCAACVWLLEKLPEVMPGLSMLRVNIVSSTATIAFDPNLVRLSVIAKTINDLGYRPRPFEQGTTARRSNPLLATRLGVAAFAAMNVMILFIARYQGLFTGIDAATSQFFSWVSLALTTPSVMFAAAPFYKTSWGGLRMRKLHIDLPIAIAILTSFAASAINTILGRPEIYYDTITVLIFLLLVGRWSQGRAMQKVASASELLSSLTPLSANRLSTDGTWQEVYIESLQTDDVVLVESESRFPADGVVTSGESLINNAILTGEQKLTPAAVGDFVWAAEKNVLAPLSFRVSATSSSSRLGSLMNDIAESPARRSELAKFADRFSVYFVLGVLALGAVTLAATLHLGWWVAWDRVIALLVVSCPCALGIATPVCLSLASAHARRIGILLKDPNALERLSNTKTVLFDKTGTLTTGSLEVVRSELIGSDVSWEEIWSALRGLEKGVEHPIARAFLNAASEGPALEFESTEPNIVGISGTTRSGESWTVGSLGGMRADADVASSSPNMHQYLSSEFTAIGILRNKSLVAAFLLGDSLRPEAQVTVNQLHQRGISARIISGDTQSVVTALAVRLNISPDNAHSGMTPEEKAALVESLGSQTMVVGDGVNDALALGRSGVGVGISGGAEICLQVADVFLTEANLLLSVRAIEGAKKVKRLIHRQLAVSVAYNIIAASLAVAGLIGPLGAAIVMPLSSLSVILTSLGARPF